MLVDTHAHLNFSDYQKDLDQVIRRSLKNGVAKIICVSSNIDDSKKAIEISQKYPGVIFPAVGIHPQQTDPETTLSPQKQIKILKKLAKSKEVVAIGECGLDYSPAPPGEKDRPKKEQSFLFKEQLKLAKKLKLPVLIHSRKAFPNTLEILNQFSPGLKGVFHCYSAGKKGVDRVNQLGFFFGVDGNFTYDQGLQNVFKEIPLEKILSETDCPFLAPEPFRGSRSEPAHIRIIAEHLAKIKNVDLEKVAKITTENVQKLFKI